MGADVLQSRYEDQTALMLLFSHRSAGYSNSDDHANAVIQVIVDHILSGRGDGEFKLEVPVDVLREEEAVDVDGAADADDVVGSEEEEEDKSAEDVEEPDAKRRKL
jgi:hypothetical protein